MRKPKDVIDLCARIKKRRKTEYAQYQARIRAIQRRYTRVVKLGPGCWNTYLQIDHQGFCVVEQTTKERARWYAKMLAVAIERMIGNESTPN